MFRKGVRVGGAVLDAINQGLVVSCAACSGDFLEAAGVLLPRCVVLCGGRVASATVVCSLQSPAGISIGVVRA